MHVRRSIHNVTETGRKSHFLSGPGYRVSVCTAHCRASARVRWGPQYAIAAMQLYGARGYCHTVSLSAVLRELRLEYSAYVPVVPCRTGSRAIRRNEMPRMSDRRTGATGDGRGAAHEPYSSCSLHKPYIQQKGRSVLYCIYT